MTSVPYLNMSLIQLIRMITNNTVKTLSNIVMVTRTVMIEGQAGLMLGVSVGLSCFSNQSTSLQCQLVAFGGIQDSLEVLSTLSVHSFATSVPLLYSLSVDSHQLEKCAPLTKLLTLMMEIGKEIGLKLIPPIYTQAQVLSSLFSMTLNTPILLPSWLPSHFYSYFSASANVSAAKLLSS